MRESMDETDLQQMMEGSSSLETSASGLHVRMMNKDGSFNSGARRSVWYERLTYTGLLTMSWPRFFLALTSVYCLSNVAFACFFLMCGPMALVGNGPDTGLGPLSRSFFFSVQTLSTIGYGALVPVGRKANLLVAVESVYGLLAYALITGLFFARFSRIRARLRFSHVAVVCNHDDTRSLQIRLANWSSGQVIELSARVLYSYLSGPETSSVRKFASLSVEPQSVAFMPLAWTLHHSIVSTSPLFELDTDRFHSLHGELLVLIKGIDEDSGQVIYSRTSYTAQEIKFGACYQDMFRRDTSGRVVEVDMSRFDQCEKQEGRD